MANDHESHVSDIAALQSSNEPHVAISPSISMILSYLLMGSEDEIVPMQRKTITITDQQESWVKSIIDTGDYGNDSEYFRDLIRRDQVRRSAESALRQLLEDAEATGFSDRRPLEIWAAAEARHKAQHD